MMAIAVGGTQTCHRNGRAWMLGMFDGNASLVDAFNNMLLVGCYLLNLGYMAMVMSLWENAITARNTCWPPGATHRDHHTRSLLLCTTRTSPCS